MRARYLRPALSMPDIYLYRAPVDFRMQAQGLAALVERELGHNGFVLYYKSLAEEKFKWPKPSDELLSLTGEQINWLLDGYDISQMQGHKKLHYEHLG